MVEDFFDVCVFVVFEFEGVVWLFFFGGCDCVFDGVGDVLGGRCRGGGYVYFKGRGWWGRFSLLVWVVVGFWVGVGVVDGVWVLCCGCY